MKFKDIKIWKFNLFDIILISIILIFIILGVSFKFGSSKANSENEYVNSFKYVLEVKGLSNTSKNMVKIGDEVYDKVSSTYIGKIIDIETSDAYSNLELLNGDIVLAQMPDKIDIKLTIETAGTSKNGEYLANNLIRIMVGNTRQIKTKYLMCQGVVTKININKK